MKNDLSKRAFDRACRVIPGGVNSRYGRSAGGSSAGFYRPGGRFAYLGHRRKSIYRLCGFLGADDPWPRYPAAVEAVCRAVEKGAVWGAQRPKPRWPKESQRRLPD